MQWLYIEKCGTSTVDKEAIWNAPHCRGWGFLSTSVISSHLISPSLYHRGAEKSISSTDEKISVELRREEKRKEDSNVKYFRELNKGTTCYIQTHIKMSFNLSSLTWKNDPMKMITGEHKAGTELSAERWQWDQEILAFTSRFMDHKGNHKQTLFNTV